MKDHETMKAELFALGVTNVRVELKTHDSTTFMIGWTEKGARMHLWLDRVTRRINPGVGRKTPTLYKNPPDDLRPTDPNYYRTRYLDARKHEPLLRRIENYADAMNLFESAVANAQAKERRRLTEAKEEARQNQVMAAGGKLLDACKDALQFIEHNTKTARENDAPRDVREQLVIKLRDAIRAAGETP